ncbi:acylphosphatase [bacterium]|nr:acylphosphatase [bacterium]
MRLHIIARGIVQGVGFRYFTRRAARESGLEGFVRNLPDGTVEAEVEGDRDMIEVFLARLKKGSAASSVTAIETEPLSSGENYQGFGIRF